MNQDTETEEISYYQKNREERLAYQKEYRQRNKEKTKAYQKEWREWNKKKLQAYQKEWRQENKEKVEAYRKEYYQGNREKLLAYRKEYYQENKEELRARRDPAKSNAYNKKRRHSTRSSGLTKEQYDEIEGIYRQAARLNGIFGKTVFHVDHTVPLSLGGKHHPSNMQVVSAKWNREKGNRHSNRWEVPYGGEE